MRQRLVRLDDGWALPLSEEQLAGIGIGKGDAAVLVRIEEGVPPRLIIHRAPTFDEAMEDTLTQHRQALVTLASIENAEGNVTGTMAPG